MRCRRRFGLKSQLWLIPNCETTGKLLNLLFNAYSRIFIIKLFNRIAFCIKICECQWKKKTMLACSYKVPLSWHVISRMCRTCRMLMEMHRSWESQTSLSSRPQTPQGKGLRLPHSQHLASTWNTGGALYKEKYMIIINQKIQASWMHSHLIFLRLGCLKCFLKSIYLHLVLNELPSCFRE